MAVCTWTVLPRTATITARSPSLNISNAKTLIKKNRRIHLCLHLSWMYMDVLLSQFSMYWNEKGTLCLVPAKLSCGMRIEMCVLEQNRTTAFTFQLIIFVPYRLPRSCYSETVRTVEMYYFRWWTTNLVQTLTNSFVLLMRIANPACVSILLINYYRISGKNVERLWCWQMWLVAHQLFISWFLKNLHSHSV